MKNLIEAQKMYIEEMDRFKAEAVRLLTAAQNAMGNYIGHCDIKECNPKNRCDFCAAWAKVWDDIDEFIKADT